MFLCFVSPAAVTESDGKVNRRAKLAQITSNYPHLGILSLVSVLDQCGVEQDVLNLNRYFREGARSEAVEAGSARFSSMVDELEGRKADVFGFGTLAGSYPLTLRLAREVKRIHPDAVVLLGGPQAAAVALPTLQAFPFVDIIVRGEAEETLPELLKALGDPDRLAGVSGISFRRNGTVVQTPDRIGLPDLDGIPDPAYHLWPGIDNATFLPMEIGRGCPYSCTFCSTSRFFRRRYRLRSPHRVIATMQRLRDAYGVTSFTLIHDAFTVDRHRVVAFCQAMQKSGQHFRWTCSARTDCVDEALLEQMTAAGCSGIFFGVETGSSRLQRAINKCLDLDEARRAIRQANSASMRTCVSMITGFPDETRDDLRDTVAFLADSLTLENVEPQFHLLAPLAGTELQQRFNARLQWDGICSDIASVGVPQAPAEIELIRDHPDVFPDFYAIPTDHLDRRFLQRFRSFTRCSMRRFRWLTVALHQHQGSLLEVFDNWHAWRESRVSGTPHDDEYYASLAFRHDFLAFVASRYEDGQCGPDGLAVETLLEYEQQLDQFAESQDEVLEPWPAMASGAFITDANALPRLASGVALFHLSADYQSIIDRLKNKRSPKDVSRRPVVVAGREGLRAGAEVVQLSALAAALLQLCDGVRTVREIAAVFPQLDKDLAGMPPEPACLFALNDLAQQRLLVFGQPQNASSAPSR